MNKLNRFPRVGVVSDSRDGEQASGASESQQLRRTLNPGKKIVSFAASDNGIIDSDGTAACSHFKTNSFRIKNTNQDIHFFFFPLPCPFGVFVPSSKSLESSPRGTGAVWSKVRVHKKDSHPQQKLPRPMPFCPGYFFIPLTKFTFPLLFSVYFHSKILSTHSITK